MLVRFVSTVRWLDLGRALPAVALAGASAFTILAARRDQDDAAFRKNLFLAVWSWLAFILTWKNVLHAWVGHYGFVLNMPAALLFVHVALCVGPRCLARRCGTGTVFRAVMVGALAACLCGHLRRSHLFYSRKTMAIGEGRDTFLHDGTATPGRRFVPVGLDYLRREVPSGASLLVLPDGTFLNYLLRLRNPTPYLMLTPWELRAFGGEGAVVGRLASARPDFIVLLSSDVSVFGRTCFGEEGYGRDIVNWISRNYGVKDTLALYDDRREKRLFLIVVYEHEADAAQDGPGPAAGAPPGTNSRPP
jgi:hypothetical protein